MYSSQSANETQSPTTPRNCEPEQVSCNAPGRDGGLSYSYVSAPGAPRKSRKS